MCFHVLKMSVLYFRVLMFMCSFVFIRFVFFCVCDVGLPFCVTAPPPFLFLYVSAMGRSMDVSMDLYLDRSMHSSMDLSMDLSMTYPWIHIWIYLWINRLIYI